jgi:hypothetical protein
MLAGPSRFQPPPASSSGRLIPGALNYSGAGDGGGFASTGNNDAGLGSISTQSQQFHSAGSLSSAVASLIAASMARTSGNGAAALAGAGGAGADAGGHSAPLQEPVGSEGPSMGSASLSRPRSGGGALGASSRLRTATGAYSNNGDVGYGGGGGPIIQPPGAGSGYGGRGPLGEGIEDDDDSAGRNGGRAAGGMSTDMSHGQYHSMTTAQLPGAAGMDDALLVRRSSNSELMDCLLHGAVQPVNVTDRFGDIA